jgi:hypothetical protein
MQALPTLAGQVFATLTAGFGVLACIGIYT